MTVISGRENVRMASRLAQRRALQFEIKTGLRRSGRPISTILKGDADFAAWLAEAGLRFPRDKRALFGLLNSFIVAKLGEDFHVDTP